MTDDEIRNEIMTKLTVPLWPVAGRALGLSRNPTYEAAANNAIPTIGIGRKKSVPTALLKKMLGLEAA